MTRARAGARWRWAWALCLLLAASAAAGAPDAGSAVDADAGAAAADGDRSPAGSAGRAEPAPGSTWEESPRGTPEEELGFGWALLRLFVVLGLVVAITYLVLNQGLRRLLGLKGLVGARSGAVLEVVERAPLDPKGALYVVRAAGDYLLLGRSEAGLSMLAKLDAEEVKRLLESRPSPGALLQRLMPKGGGQEPR